MSAGDASVAVQLTDWCQCYKGERRERVIDLSDVAFARLAPLASGLVRVTVSLPRPPATDAAPVVHNEGRRASAGTDTLSLTPRWWTCLHWTRRFDWRASSR